MSSRIESRPTDGLSYNPNESKYWDRTGFEKELTRVYDICHGCRLCFNLCPSFPALFDAVDAKGDDVRDLTAAERERVELLTRGLTNKLLHRILSGLKQRDDKTLDAAFTAEVARRLLGAEFDAQDDDPDDADNENDDGDSGIE